MAYILIGILLSHKKEWNLAIRNHMDGSRGYEAKRNKPDRERPIPHDFTYMRNLRKTQQTKVQCTFQCRDVLISFGDKWQ